MTDRDAVDQFDPDDELRALLRRNDPAASLPPADPASTALLLQEIVRTADPVGPTRRRGALTWIAGSAAAAVVLVAGIGAISQFGQHDASPIADSRPSAGPGPGTSPSADAPTASSSPPAPAEPLSELSVSSAALDARCAAPNAAMLASTDAAFTGTVTAISGRHVTMTTGSVVHGSVAPTVTVTSGDFGRLVQTVHFKVGKPYLIAAYGGQLAVCGFSGPAKGSLRALYAEAFPR